MRVAPAADQPLSANRFVTAVAGWTGAATGNALRGVGAVLGAVADLADEELMGRLLLQLPADYEVLFDAPQRARSAGHS